MDTISISDLRADLKGRVIVPGDPDYDQTRSVVFGGFDRRPALIVRAAYAADVSLAVKFAKESGLPLAIRSGGHSTVGHSTTEGGIVIDLRDMKGIDIDLDSRTVWAETGLTTGALSAATVPHGLAVGFGDSGSVGIGGITLGGGIGYLVRKHGLTIDSVLAAEVVTANGDILRVDAGNHPDLFWAIRGGGGNFGVVTRLKFQLHDLSSFYGGLLVLPATPETVAGFVAAAEAAPEELTSIPAVMTAPPVPFLPPEMHGQLVLMAFMAYTGEVSEGEKAVAPFRALATPIVDMVRPSSYLEMFPPEDNSFRPFFSIRTIFMDKIDAEDAREMIDRIQSSDAMVRAVQIRVLGGAMARVPVDATAFAHRRSRILAGFVALYMDPREREQREAWVDEFAAGFRQSDGGVYVNFLGDESELNVRSAYPGSTLDRLVEIKRRYDPTNLFRLNHNIPVSAGSEEWRNENVA